MRFNKIYQREHCNTLYTNGIVAPGGISDITGSHLKRSRSSEIHIYITYGMCWWAVNTVSTFQAVCLTLRIRGKYDRAITLRKILSQRDDRSKDV